MLRRADAAPWVDVWGTRPTHRTLLLDAMIEQALTRAFNLGVCHSSIWLCIRTLPCFDQYDLPKFGTHGSSSCCSRAHNKEEGSCW